MEIASVSTEDAAFTYLDGEDNETTWPGNFFFLETAVLNACRPKPDSVLPLFPSRRHPSRWNSIQKDCYLTYPTYSIVLHPYISWGCFYFLLPTLCILLSEDKVRMIIMLAVELK